MSELQLQLLIIIGFIVGCLCSTIKIKTSTNFIEDKDLWSYFIGK